MSVTSLFIARPCLSNIAAYLPSTTSLGATASYLRPASSYNRVTFNTGVPHKTSRPDTRMAGEDGNGSGDGGAKKPRVTKKKSPRGRWLPES